MAVLMMALPSFSCLILVAIASVSLVPSSPSVALACDVTISDSTDITSDVNTAFAESSSLSDFELCIYGYNTGCDTDPMMDAGGRSITITGLGEGATIDCEGQGAAFQFIEDNVTISGLHIIGATSESEGGAAVHFFNGSQLTIVDCVFENAYSNSYGGAVIAGGGNLRGDVLVMRSVFSNCTIDPSVSAAGGSLTGDQLVLLTVIDCVFNDSYADFSGGAVAVIDTLESTFTGSHFERCASNEGGGISIMTGYGNTSHLVDDCTFFDLVGVTNGGGIIADIADGHLVVSNSYFEDTESPIAGGAIVFRDSPVGTNGRLDVYSSFFTSCTSGTGSSIYLTFANCMVTSCLFEGNTGAEATVVFVVNEPSHSLDVFSSSFYNNNDGGIVANVGHVNVVGSTFYFNHGPFGGAVYAFSADLTLDSCFMSGNTATNGGAVYTDGDSHHHITQSIFESNVGDFGTIMMIGGASNGTMERCVVTGSYSPLGPVPAIYVEGELTMQYVRLCDVSEPAIDCAGSGVVDGEFNCTSGANICCAPQTENYWPTSSNYSCGPCAAGFFTMDAGETCDDVDECLSSPCPFSPCMNTYGSFACAPCSDGTHSCAEDSECVDESLGATCVCLPGFMGNGSVCTDVDECALGGGHTCSPAAQCTNSDGSFLCVCQPGYTGDGVLCNDINECSDAGVCPPASACVNTLGSFECECTIGTHPSGQCMESLCGDDSVSGHEECDDGNVESGDGCTAWCYVEERPCRSRDRDCSGTCNGFAIVDDCGVCSGGRTGIVPNAAKDRCGVCWGGNAAEDDCGVCGGGNALKDECGVCRGNDSTCSGCDGVPNSGLVVDVCGICGGDGLSCLGCNDLPMNNGGTVFDACGECGGPGGDCVFDCNGVPFGTSVYDCSGVCGGSAIVDNCGVCSGGETGVNPGAHNTGCGCFNDCANSCDEDACGVCGGTGTTCADCQGVPRGGATFDACGQCGGSATSLADCDFDCAGTHGGSAIFDCSGQCGGGATLDTCGVCTGGQTGLVAEGHRDSCGLCFGGDASLDGCGVCGGNDESRDDCGVCFGRNASRDDCGECYGENRAKDQCGVCGGNSTTCLGCDGIPNSGRVNCAVVMTATEPESPEENEELDAQRRRRIAVGVGSGVGASFVITSFVFFMFFLVRRRRQNQVAPDPASNFNGTVSSTAPATSDDTVAISGHEKTDKNEVGLVEIRPRQRQEE